MCINANHRRSSSRLGERRARAAEIAAAVPEEGSGGAARRGSRTNTSGSGDREERERPGNLSESYVIRPGGRAPFG
jgi:hypothetical protein